ncbi:unnamed protein product [Ambrosiozyma monospora]|uniref:Unnamed protein product n=1 Tax=Ambrosiozyma monospora TaxID=43982 RepID=A0ACB5T1H1_AMBMO|nr:unnamed protein product [Ambrosiozyma monospora]
MVAPLFTKQPIRWCRYHAYTNPNLFYSGVIALMGPVFLFGVTPLRRKYLYEDLKPLPLSGYPIPKERKNVTGYAD